MRTNKSALKAICKAICNTCYVDADVLEELLAQNGLEPDTEAVVSQEKDATLVKIACTIVKGWAETSRSEGGISTGINTAGIDASIRLWCNKYGIDAEEFLIGSSTIIENGSNLW